MTEDVASGIAQRTPEPFAWAEGAVDLQLGPKVVGPLLCTARQSDRERALTTMMRALGAENTRNVAVRIVLVSDNPLDAEVQAVFKLVDQHDDLALEIEALAALNAIPTRTIRQLLCHPSQVITEVIAVHLWSQDSDPNVPVELYDDWRAAILRASGTSHMILQVFENDTEVFFDWLIVHIDDGSLNKSYWITDRLTDALSRLSTSQRVEALNSISEQHTFGLSQVISDLVGDDMTVFERFLAMDHLARTHRAAFASVSREKIMVATRLGWSDEKVASAILDPSIPVMMMGEESNHWQSSCDYFSSLSESSDAEIVAVGRAGYAMAKAELNRALRRERDEDVYGY